MAVHDVALCMYIGLVCFISKLTNIYSYSMNAPLSLFVSVMFADHSALYAEKW